MSDLSNQAKSIFLAAIEEHAPEQWPGFLDQACAGDVRLRAEVEKLLHSRSEMGSFHEPPQPAPLATVDVAVDRACRLSRFSVTQDVTVHFAEGQSATRFVHTRTFVMHFDE